MSTARVLRLIVACLGVTLVGCGASRSKIEGTTMALAPGLCSESGWCWENPLPQGNALGDVWGSGPRDIWAIGARGLALHFDGVTWSRSETGAGDAALRGVWGSGPHDVWAVGVAGGALHFDGRAWSFVPGPFAGAASAIWGSADDDVWMVGPEGLARWNGSSWSTVTNPSEFGFEGIWGSGSDDVWAVGFKGTIAHWTGAAWSIVESATVEILREVWGTGPDDVWAAGEQGSLVHWNGRGWARSSTETTATIDGLWGSGPNDVWLGCDDGSLRRWNGSSWAVEMRGARSMAGLWGAAAGDVWAVGSGGTILHWDGATWSVSAGSASPVTLKAAWATSPNDVWAVGDQGAILHEDGVVWRAVESGTKVQLRGVWSGRAGDVWVVGAGGTVLHREASSWVTVPVGVTSDLNAVWGAASDDLWAIGDEGVVLHRVGTKWDRVESGTTWRLFAGWGSGRSDAWAVGEAGTILHWDGARGEIVDSPTSANLFGVSGTAPDDVWAVGERGAILHWNGQGWSVIDTAVTLELGVPVLSGIWARSRDDAWAVDALGRTLHWDGIGWADVDNGTTGQLRALCGLPGGDNWAVGAGGAILRRHAGARVPSPDASASSPPDAAADGPASDGSATVTLAVTVKAARDQVVSGIVELRVHAQSAAHSWSNTSNFSPFRLDSGASINFGLPVEEHAGAVALSAEARDGDGHIVGQGAGSVFVAADSPVPATIELYATADAGAAEGAPPSRGCDLLTPDCPNNQSCTATCGGPPACIFGGPGKHGDKCDSNRDCGPGTQCYDFSATGCGVKVCLRYCSDAMPCSDVRTMGHPFARCDLDVECPGASAAARLCTLSCDPRYAAQRDGATLCPAGMVCLMTGTNDSRGDMDRARCSCPVATRAKAEGQSCATIDDCQPGLNCVIDLMGASTCRPICRCELRNGSSTCTTTAGTIDCPAGQKCVEQIASQLFGACLPWPQ
jgi:hypothetical protein